MSYFGSKDYYLEVRRGNVPDAIAVNKFAQSTNVDSVATDIWGRANATDDQDIWVAPTAARTHNIASSSSSDDGSPAGVGARTLRVWGLTSWSSVETSEDITLNGTSNVATANSYVIIHRMQVLTKGGTSTNVGKLTATAQTDGTVTAQINAGDGQTLLSVYGVPSGYSLYIKNIHASIHKAGGGTALCDMKLLVNPEPDVQLTNFVLRHAWAIDSDASSNAEISFCPPKKFSGPCIVKMQGNASADNQTISGAYDGVVLKD